MMLTSTTCGIFMFAVHIFSVKMPSAEYGLFGALLQIGVLLMIPALGLQTVLTQQMAGATSEQKIRILRGTARALLMWTFMIWLGVVLLAVCLRVEIIAILKIANPAALWVTVAFALPQLWLPIMQGLLQGSQNFLWLGWATLINGLGRFLAVAVIVVFLGGLAAGAVTGALIGLVLACGLAAWHSRELWMGPSLPFDWRSWLGRILPLTFGLGASHFLLSIDMIVVRSLFEESRTGYYAGASMMGRGIVMFTAPLVWVMFPKIVRSVVRDEKTGVLAQALGATALLGVVLASLLSIAALIVPYGIGLLEANSLPVSAGLRASILDKSAALLVVASLIPWFVWCMLPLALANVLINNLLARERYGAVPYLMIVAAGYAAALSHFNGSFVNVIQVMGLFSLLMLGVAAGFTWLDQTGVPARRCPAGTGLDSRGAP